MNTKLVLAGLLALIGTSVMSVAAQATPRALTTGEMSSYVVAVNQRLRVTPMMCVKQDGTTYTLSGISDDVMDGSWVDASGAQPALSLNINAYSGRAVHMFKLTPDFKMITEIMIQNQVQGSVDHGTIVAPIVTLDWITQKSAVCKPFVTAPGTIPAAQ